MESQAVFQAETQAKIFSIELGPWAAEMEPMVERLFCPAASASALHRLAAAAEATFLSGGLDLVARKHLGIFLLSPLLVSQIKHRRHYSGCRFNKF